MSEEAKEELLLKKVRAIVNEVTESSEEALTKDLLELKLHRSLLALEDAVVIIQEKAIEEPEQCAIYTRICAKLVNDELQDGGKFSRIAQALQLSKRDPFYSGETLWAYLKKEREMQAEIASETDAKKQEEKQIVLLEMQYDINRKRFVDIKFIGHLYLYDLVHVRVIFDAATKLLASVTDKPQKGGVYEADEVSIDRAIWLFETVGKKLQEHNDEIEKAADTGRMPFPIDRSFEVLEKATHIVSPPLKVKIANVITLRANDWIKEE